MRTINIDQEKEQLSLDELIPMYAQNKLELDSYKNLCDKENKQIKELMVSADETSHTVGDHVAKLVISKRESLSADQLLSVLKKYGINNLVKTVEIVDMELFEKFMYNFDKVYTNDDKEELLCDIQKCTQVQEVAQLRISKKKNREE